MYPETEFLLPFTGSISSRRNILFKLFACIFCPVFFFCLSNLPREKEKFAIIKRNIKKFLLMITEFDIYLALGLAGLLLVLSTRLAISLYTAT